MDQGRLRPHSGHLAGDNQTSAMRDEAVIRKNTSLGQAKTKFLMRNLGVLKLICTMQAKFFWLFQNGLTHS